jgi:tRNA G37 N-methylase Trm5
MENVVTFAHQTILQHITKNSIVIDATVGNGHDTIFLAKYSKHVFGFDIQNQAIERTKNQCTKANLSNVTLFLASHEDITQYVNQKVDAVMYNLGYLPDGDKSITTKATTTIHSILNVLPILKPKGIITITIYIGHEEGKKERIALEEFFLTLDASLYSVVRYQIVNKSLAPYTICIQKK